MDTGEPTRRLFAPLASSLGLLASLAAPAAAQTSFTVSIGRTFQSLATADETGQATDASFDVERSFSKYVRLFYKGDLETFSSPGDWGYALHGGGVVLDNAPASDTATRVVAGASGWWRTNGDAWSAAGYTGLRGFVDVEWHPSATATIHAGYQFDARAFNELPELDQREHTVFASVLANVQPTRTAVIGEVVSGAKTYAASPDSTSPAARQVTVLGRVAQNVTADIGVSLQYMRRFTFGRVPPALVLTPPLFFDDGVYDDPFASDARSWRIGATRLIGSSGSLDAAIAQAHKDYSDFARFDTILRAGVTWTLPVLRGRTGPVGVNVNLGYGYTDHQSTDLFYNYTSHALAVGMTFAY